MPYTIIVCDDGSLYGSHKKKIMQREKLFNKLWILVHPLYNGYDMSQCTVTMRYLLPISNEFKTETLELSNEKYEEYLKYVLPVDTNLTKEWGEIKLNLTFTMLDADENGKIVQRVRKTEDYMLNITKLPDWDSVIPDSALSALDQRILKQDAQIEELKQLAKTLDDNKADSLLYNDVDDTLQLSSNGMRIGKKVSVKDMLDDGIPVVELSRNLNTDNDNGCNCGCEDNVVEFGDTNIAEKQDEKYNVVLF